MEETHTAFDAGAGQQEGRPQQQPFLQMLSLASVHLPSPQELLALGKSLSEQGPLQGLPSHQPSSDQGMPQQVSDPTAGTQQSSRHPSDQQDRYAAAASSEPSIC